MLELTDVSKAFGTKAVIDRFSLRVDDGEVVCLLGPSGCGKTTLLRIAAGLLAPDRGSRSYSGARASFVFQEDRLLPWFDTLENLVAVGVAADVAIRALKDVGLGDDLHTLPETLSGGMRRRVAIARALAFGGDTFFLDEPLQGLDTETGDTVLRVLKRVLHGKTALLITHRAVEAFHLADRLLRVDGPPVRLVDSARVGDFDSAEAIETWLMKGNG